MKTGYPSGNEVYWRIYQSTSNLMTVVCMQWFDEPDYFKENFVRNADQVPYYFDSEEEAIDQLNIWYKTDQINPEYRKRDINLIK